jgi:hypothetical protein
MLVYKGIHHTHTPTFPVRNSLIPKPHFMLSSTPEVIYEIIPKHSWLSSDTVIFHHPLCGGLQ